jgi:hypothetical protein
MTMPKEEIEKIQEHLKDYVKQHGHNTEELLKHLASFLAIVNSTGNKFTKDDPAYSQCIANGLKNGTVHPSAEGLIKQHTDISKMPIKDFTIPSFSGKPSTPRPGKPG